MKTRIPRKKKKQIKKYFENQIGQKVKLKIIRFNPSYKKFIHGLVHQMEEQRKRTEEIIIDSILFGK